MFDWFLSIFSVKTVLFTVPYFAYPMTYLEFFGTLANLACVFLAAKNKIWTWPIGLIGIIFYLFLFYQIQLYSDFFEQIYFFGATFYGWYLWSSIRSNKVVDGLSVDGFSTKMNPNKPIVIEWGSLTFNMNWVLGIIIATFFGYMFVLRVNIWFPKQFPLPASYPLLDTFTTILSFAATILMAQRKITCWVFWIIVDVIGIWLYWVKGVKFISIEYMIFLGNAIYGLWFWLKQYKETVK